MELADAIRQIKANLREGRFANEQSVSQGAVLPVLQALGWPVFDTTVVAPQYGLRSPRGENRRSDFALCRNPRQPLAIVEVKAVGRAGGADEQLFEYCFHAGVPFALLTDGQEWHFYLPMEAGSYDDRRVYRLDLLMQDDTVCCERLERYLDRGSVLRGRNLERARRDRDDATRGAQIRNALPQAWQNLLVAPDSYLCEMLAMKVADLCGFQPDIDTCADFITANTTIISGFTATSTPQPDAAPVAPPPTPIEPPDSDTPSFVFRGRSYPCSTNTAVMIALFNKLAGQYPDFLERYAARKHGYSRRFLSQDKYRLYPGQPERCESHSAELDVGRWFIATHQSRATIEASVRLACEVLGLRYGSEIIVNLRSRTPVAR